MSKDQLAKKQASEKKIKEDVQNASFDKNNELLLDYAQKIYDSEVERRKVTEAKATTFLAFIAAIIPILLSIQNSYWEHKAGPAPEWLKLLFLILGILYIAMAGHYSIKTLNVAGFAAIGSKDILLISNKKNGTSYIIKQLLSAYQISQDNINRKVTMIKLTIAHLERAFLCFIILLLSDPIAKGISIMIMDAPPKKENCNHYSCCTSFLKIDNVSKQSSMCKP